MPKTRRVISSLAGGAVPLPSLKREAFAILMGLARREVRGIRGEVERATDRWLRLTRRLDGAMGPTTAAASEALVTATERVRQLEQQLIVALNSNKPIVDEDERRST